MKKTVLFAAAITLLAAPAFAQGAGGSQSAGGPLGNMQRQGVSGGQGSGAGMMGRRGDQGMAMQSEGRPMMRSKKMKKSKKMMRSRSRSM